MQTVDIAGFKVFENALYRTHTVYLYIVKTVPYVVFNGFRGVVQKVHRHHQKDSDDTDKIHT